MCGIVGVISSTRLIKREKDIFEELWHSDWVRGKQSAGAFSIGTDTTKKAAVLKTVRHVADILESKWGQEFMDEQTYGIIGHNRAATRGSVKSANAHPFQHGPVTLVHNGTLSSTTGLKRTFEVDSEGIAYTLSETPVDKAKEALGELNGAYALIWHDARDGSINIAKNAQRSLSMCLHMGVIYLASEEMMLDWVLARNNLSGYRIMSVDEGVHHKFYVGGQWKYEKMGEIPKKASTTTNSGSAGAASGTSRYSRTSLAVVIDSLAWTKYPSSNEYGYIHGKVKHLFAADREELVKRDVKEGTLVFKQGVRAVEFEALQSKTNGGVARAYLTGVWDGKPHYSHEGSDSRWFQMMDTPLSINMDIYQKDANGCLYFPSATEAQNKAESKEEKKTEVAANTSARFQGPAYDVLTDSFGDKTSVPANGQQIRGVYIACAFCEETIAENDIAKVVIDDGLIACPVCAARLHINPAAKITH